MKVTFAYYGESLASSRLRARIPQEQLELHGVQKGRDVLVYGKHWLKKEEISCFDKKIYDICDDHFDGPHGEYYRSHAAMADAITCNSEFMRQRIFEETGRESIVIPEPYESPEMIPRIGDTVFWFGHQSNLGDLERVAQEIRHPVMILTGKEWSRESFMKMISSPCIVIIPTGKSMAKSENRMVEAIRCGRYVCAEHLPAYEPFSKFFPLVDIPSHIDKALSDPEGSLESIWNAQDYISERYSPETIGKQWLEVIHEHC